MRLSRLSAIVAVILIGVTLGCSTDECTQNQSSRPLAGLYSASLDPKKISIDSLTIFGLGAPDDSVLYNGQRNVSELFLPFRIEEDSTTYVIRYDQKALAQWEIADTITFRYQTVPFFVSTACGVIYKYDVRRIDHTTWLIDSVTCPGGVIDNMPVENLRIYFRTE